MYNLDDVIRIYYNCISVQDILSKRSDYNKFAEREFQRLAKVYLSIYSDTENRELYDYIQGSTKEEGHPYAGMQGRSGLNVFAALEELTEQLLIMEDNKVLCQFRKLIRLRDITHYIDEDMLVCAYLAVRHKRFTENHTYFSWQISIGHNNVQLNNILARGMSENHFHLYGSAPTFHLIWTHLMNHVYGNEIAAFFAEMDSRPRVTREHYYVGYRETGFLTRIRQAALIRSYLVYYLRYNESPDKTGAIMKYSEVKKVLYDPEQVHDFLFEIQQMVDYQKELMLINGWEEYEDYALYGVKQSIQVQKHIDFIFAGERWFLYQMFVKELTDSHFNKEFFKWFWAYLVIKNQLRNEFVQTNTMVGFENFAIYNSRKNMYMNYSQMAKTAVFSSTRGGKIKSLEIRITPKDTAEGNADLIENLDRTIMEDSFCPFSFEGRKEEKNSQSFYYVFHFAKKKDESLQSKELMDEISCRHYTYRIKLYQKANAVMEFRDRYYKLAGRVLGIDACSQEIGCRPEVFAIVFRMLANHVRDNVLGGDVNQLKLTYHVGEDFLDVVDGLRAVDEAIHFLDLQCGDRIGHGTVLGIDVREWYNFKRNTILISQQDYLDNIVWLYHKLVEFDIKDCENVKEHLMQQFDKYFSKIYTENIHLKQTAYIWMDEKKAEEIKMGITRFNIHTYYEAWKLRGDDPGLYVNGYFNKGLEYSLNDYAVNKRYPEDFSNRERSEVGFLYYLYHYNWDIRSAGSKVEEIYIQPEFVNSVVIVQKKMGKYIASCGIGVETNPSSNVSISTFKNYDEHPIIRLYNKDLTWDIEKLRENPQISVSINTDDKGVFHTSLENEYSLLACALEKVKDEEGNPVYNRQMIYQWLDNIREMGNLQSFLRKNEEN